MTRTPKNRSQLLLLAAFGLGLPAAALGQTAITASPVAAQGSATRILLEKAHSLEGKGRMDMAAQTWQQVLLADPNNTDALGGLARAAKLAGNLALANTYLQRLRAVSPSDPGIARAETMMTQSSQLAELQQAGRLAGQGNYVQAMAIYRRVFGSTPPAGEWALAYYETEAATDSGHPHAVAGLRSLVGTYPQDSRYGVTLGRILTYKPNTRAEGRRVLERYPHDPQAAEALRQSFVWDAGNPATSDEVRAYLRSHPDPGLQQSLRTTENQASAAAARNSQAGSVVAGTAQVRAMGGEERAAYAALNAKRYAEADSRFSALLAKNPRDGRALAGMGYVRMNQHNFGGAISFFEQARQDGATDPALDRNLQTARFFLVLGEGRTALDDNDLTTAESRYRQALQLRPNSPEAFQGLAGTLLKAGQPQAALPYFQQLVRGKPTVAAYRGLFTAQFQAGNSSAALDTDKHLPEAVRVQLLRDPDYLRTLASAYMSVGRDADAQRVLRFALDLPFPPGAQGLKAETALQYASLLLQANRTEQAVGLYRQVLAADGNNVLAWQGLINAEHSMGNDTVALQTLESMPPAVYDQALRDPGFLVGTAAIYQANSKPDLAQSLLERAIAAQNTSGQRVPLPLQLQLAGLYLQRGDAAHAYPIYRRILAENPERIDAWKGLLNALHAAGRDQEALAENQQIPPVVLRQLENDVQYLQVIGQVYGSLGDAHQALAFLARVQQHYARQHTAPPANIDIQNAWLLYNGGSDTGLYRQLLALGGRRDLSDDQRRTVQVIWASWAVRRANQSSAAGNAHRALAILNAAASAFPDNPAVIKALAGGYVRAGLPKEAVAIFKSHDMSSESAADYKTAAGAALAANDLKDSEVWLRYALDLYPRDAEILNLAAKFEQARGDSNRAADFYRASLAALPPPDPGAELATILHQPAPLNPRSTPSLRSQDLASLLAPGTEPAAEAAAPPYLPSDDSAPVQLDSTAPQVPSYMGTRSGTSRLGDYRPAVPDSNSAPQPPAATYTPRSANTIPTDAEPLPLEPDSQPYLAFQQTQVRRANDAAVLANANPEPAFETRLEGAQTGDFNGEVYGPYIPYQAPTTKGPATVRYSASPVDVRESTIITDFPTAPGVPVQLHTARATTPASGVAHLRDEAAEAAETRRHQSDPLPAAAPAPINLASTQNAQYTPGALPPTGQIPRPSSPSTSANPQAGAQQYPRPNDRPSSSVAARRRSRPRAPQRVESFGVSNAPIFYPQVPAALGSEPYPDLPPYNTAGSGVPTDGELIARNVPPLRGSYGAVDTGATGGPPLTPRQQTELDLAQLDSSYSGWTGGSGFVRTRSGQPGIDRLYDFEIPVEATFAAGRTVRFSVVPRAVFLNSGTIDLTRYTAGLAPTLGTLPANAVNTPTPQYSSGLGGEFQAVTRNLGLAVGYTPYEFLVNNVIARARYRIAGGPFTVFGERDSVKETQLSYAGLRDPGSVSLLNSGNIWGGVVATGGGLRFDHGNERAGLYISGDGAALTGFHILQNRRYEGTAGAYFRVTQFPGYGTLNIGASLFAMHFDQNQRALSYGSGGYFSPEIYFLGSIPVTFNGSYKTSWHYIVQGAVGVQTFQEDAALLFPLDPALQTGVQSGCTLAQLANRTCTAAFLPNNTSTGANFSVEAQGAYRVTDHWYVGGALAANNTNNYNVVQPTVFLRYTFRPQFATEDYPTGLFPISGFRPLRVP